jgi:LysW-gamma-L-lysine carboxypeptidase
MCVSDEQAIGFLRALLERYSPSGEERAVAEQAVAAMRAWGLEAEVDGAGNAVGWIGEGPREITLLGHIDTVPGQIAVRQEGDRLYGRGAVDAKGPFAAFVVAVARIGATAPTGALPGARLRVVGAVEEEAATSAGARYALEHYPRPVAAIIGEPSAWHRITLGYKGRLLVDYMLECPMSHTAGQDCGGCELAVAYWHRVQAWAEAYNADKAGRFDTLDPSLRTINTRSDGLTEIIEMHIGLRLPLGLDVEALQAELLSWAGAARVTLRARERPYRADKRNALTSAFLAAIRAEGGEPAFVTKTGTSDMNVLGPHWQCPMVAYGPGDSSLDHTPDEHILVPEYLAAIRVLARVLRRLGEG